MDDQNRDGAQDLRNPEILSHVTDRLNQLRKRLLDFSRRNPLVHTKLTSKASILRVVDELPEVILGSLMAGQAMRLLPLPALEEELPDEQTDEFLDALHLARQEDESFRKDLEGLDPASPDYAELEVKAERALKDRLRDSLGLPRRQTKDAPSLTEHAKTHDISPSYILPFEQHRDGRHTDMNIQTLMLPDKLARVAKGLIEKGRSFERETGVGVLHAAFGLLEWRAPGDRESQVSPLLLMEIAITRRESKNGPEFHIVGSGSLAINTTLKEKLLSEHHLDLPAYEVEQIEDYFEQIADEGPQGWEWKLRREIVFGIFPSSKLAMYHDLDPSKRALAEHPVIARLLATAGSGEGAYAEVYGSDSPEVAVKVPYLVMDADASQFSALADVADGKDLSIEGPPGSGKSQTIVNLIAAALAGGKKVLFVAEKLTALEVVKNRLDSMRLGEFILPLQPGTTHDHIYKSVAERLEIDTYDRGSQRDFASQQQALERQRAILQGYLDALGSAFGSSGFTVHEVIGHAIATGDVRDTVPKEVRRIRLPGSDALGRAQIEHIVNDAQAFAERLNKSVHMPRLWLDVRSPVQNRDTAEDIGEQAGNLADRLAGFEAEARSGACALLLGEDVFRADLGRLRDMLAVMSEHGDRLDPGMVRGLLLPQGRRELRDFCDLVLKHRQTAHELAEALARPEDGLVLEQLEEALAFARDTLPGIAPVRHRQKLDELEKEIAALQAIIAAAKEMPEDWAVKDTGGLHRIQWRARDIAKVPETIRGLRLASPPGQSPRDLFGKLGATHAELSGGLEEVRKFLPKAGCHDREKMLQAGEAIAASGALRFLSSAFKAARRTYVEDLGGSASDPRETMTRRLQDYARWLRAREEFERDTTFAAAYGPLFRGLETDLDTLRAASEFQMLCAGIAGADERLRLALETGDLTAVEAFAEMSNVPEVTLSELVRRVAILEGERNREARLLETAERHLRLFRDRQTVTKGDVEEIIAGKRRELDLLSRIETAPLAGKLGVRFAGSDTDVLMLQAEADLAERMASSHAPETILAVLEEGRAAQLLTEIDRLKAYRDALEADASAFSANCDLPEDMRGMAALSRRIEDLRQAAADPTSLMERARLGRNEDNLRRHGFGLLVNWAFTEAQDIEPAEFGRITRAIIAKSMADRALEIHETRMAGYDGEDFDRIRAEIVAKDRELIRISREVVRSRLVAEADPPSGNNIGRKSDFTDMSLIHHELSKKKRRLGARALTARAGSALLELKPCWMMSPLAVAQYLPPRSRFDLVVIDEASQMTPENAIGALSRGKQVVVVGDTKQLPPTSFFQKMIDDTDVPEDMQEDSESILDLANMAFRPVRQLRWHYRSRHSALIRFSNKWMYDEKLTIFPSADEDDPEMGVELVEVDGVYRGRTNTVEAHALVESVLQHMRDTPDLSLGVCTMNSDQRELILEEFERERDRNPHVQDYVRRWEEEKGGLEEFFVKNLETIQGDERDVMFISTLYGPETVGGRTHQRFGPINSAQGHRRLNVLFTRAKRKIVTFTSLKPSDILADESKNLGVRMFRAWLEYCKTGAVPDRRLPGGSTESPFEDFVLQSIEQMGYEAVPQVGAAKYRIDIGVRHPDFPYGYILAVECDGAAYHSSKSSRDRDRLRQDVLQDLGWHFYRIWSTDWYRDTHVQKEKLRQALEAALARAKAKPPRTVRRMTPAAVTAAPSPSPANESVRPRQDRAAAPDLTRLTSKIGKAENQGDLFSRSGVPETQPGGLALGWADPSGTTDKAPEDMPGNVIRIGSRVRIESLSDGKKKAFTLVREQSNLSEGELSVFTPLGQALLEAREGEEVEYQVGVDIREVRVLSVAAP
ncbi:DUF4011 domain-containing protein [Paracoccus shandongensis]|uniref:DUF4011 domain-containing protein n=1 Tax=Paracoccus shandongensis TaxID=2816048 RepID=UPI001A8DFCEE|nr:DUF4011 domain-containing protein [Paracoccus shandongensis]